MSGSASTSSLQTRHQECLGQLKAHGQEHLLRWWPQLSEVERGLLLADIESIPWSTIARLIDTHLRPAHTTTAPADLAPAPVYAQPPAPGDEKLYAEARATGEAMLRAGKVAAFTVAGGQGTRLGYDGPKGAVVVTPTGDRTLFQLFAGSVKAARNRYRTAIPWYIMTSPANHDQTVAYFEAQRYFELPREDVSLFPQGMLPSFGFDARILLSEKHRVALNPDGHGGSLNALVRSGALSEMRSRGVETISYFQVDNPLVKPIDPLFIGLHARTGSEMSTKVATKADNLERVGNVCKSNGKLTVIEYSDFPKSCAHARNPDGTRRFDAGNLAMHLLNVEFVERIAGPSLQLPYRRAEKVVPFLDDSGIRRTPTAPNAVKLETFIFDVIPIARNPLLLQVDRAEEFSPVKNPTGVDSLESSKRDQIARACRWLEASGIRIPRKPDGQPDCIVAIAPSFADCAEEVAAKRERIPALKRGDRVFME